MQEGDDQETSCGPCLEHPRRNNGRSFSEELIHTGKHDHHGANGQKGDGLSATPYRFTVIEANKKESDATNDEEKTEEVEFTEKFFD